MLTGNKYNYYHVYVTQNKKMSCTDALKCIICNRKPATKKKVPAIKSNEPQWTNSIRLARELEPNINKQTKKRRKNASLLFQQNFLQKYSIHEFDQASNHRFKLRTLLIVNDGHAASHRIIGAIFQSVFLELVFRSFFLFFSPFSFMDWKFAFDSLCSVFLFNFFNVCATYIGMGAELCLWHVQPKIIRI